MVAGLSETRLTAAGPPAETIPWTAMASRYQGLKKQHAQRLRQLAYDLADPDPLIADFAASLAAFDRYGNVDERFYDPRTRKSLPDPQSVHDLANGRAVLAKVAEVGTCRVGSGRTYQYVDYELVPTRKTPGTVTFDNEKTWQSAISLDLLLATAGAPVVGEVKARTDKDTYFALVQALAHAAHLGTKLQIQRLKNCYPGQIRGGPVHLAIILSERPKRSNYLELLQHGAQLLADALLHDKRVTDQIGSIKFLAAQLNSDGRLTLSRIASPTRQLVSQALKPLPELKKTIKSWEDELVLRYGLAHPLLSTDSPRDVWWFKDAAAALAGSTGRGRPTG